MKLHKRALWLILLLLAILLPALFLVGCTELDPYPEDMWGQSIYPSITDTYQIGNALHRYDSGYFRQIFLNGVLLVPGIGAEVDPVFTVSDVFGVTAADIAGWTNHPALTTGTHGVVGTIVGTSDAQSLTNKNLTMNNNVPIFWKDTLGANVEVLNFFNWLDILAGESKDIILWLSSGTGQKLYLWGSNATAISTTKDAPIISLLATYWNVGSHNWEAKIQHGMVTGGVAPKSRLGFLINDLAVLRLENDNGTVKTYSDGTLDMTTHQINNVVDPTLAQDAATKNYVDDRTNYAGMYRHESVAITAIQQVDDWHLVNGFTTSDTGGGWTFHAGEQLTITAFADNGDGKTKITVVAHTLINGDIISISNTTSYDGVWIVEQVLVNTFVINTPWVADEGVKVGEHGSHFHSATASSVGKYLVTYSLSIKPESANCVIEATVYDQATQEFESESVTKLGAITDYQNVAGFSIVDISVNDVISLALRNITDGGDFTIRDGNMTAVRLGS